MYTDFIGRYFTVYMSISHEFTDRYFDQYTPSKNSFAYEKKTREENMVKFFPSKLETWDVCVESERERRRRRDRNTFQT